jgi:hypothetical protein
MSAAATPQLDYLTGPESFSRIQNIKGTLEALCLQVRIKAQNTLIGASEPVGAPLHNQERSSEPAIRALEQEMQEFQGTEQELELAHDLLIALKVAQRFDRWTDVYLKALYQCPMHPVVLHFAPEAVQIGKAAGRQEEILRGLAHVTAIPLEFEGKDTIAALLMALRTDYASAHFGPSSALITQHSKL